jgi:hypothetical protein
LQLRPLHRNIRVERTHASSSQGAQVGGVPHQRIARVIYPDGQTNNAVVAHFTVEWPNPDRALSGPGWFGYPLAEAPETVQIFIDSNTHPYFRFFAIAILTTMLLKDSAIAWFKLKDDTSKPSPPSTRAQTLCREN